VSQAQWNRVMGANTNPSIRQGSPKLPVENVSWADAVRFCERLSAMEGRRYRLPSEAEWECAARAGSTGPWPFPEADIKAGKCFNFYDRSCTEDMPFPRDGNDGVDHTADIGTYQPNAWGFYDMLGNVWEWTSTPTIPDDPNDIVNSTWNAHRKVSDAAPGEPIYYVLRGGSYLMPHWVCRSANRYGRPATVREVGADIGFRVAMDR
jgi:formylglycine-generating enzyme required for sulfatase activity